MKLVVNLNKYNSKEKLLNYFKNYLTEMYSPNYDALIDALTSFEANLEIILDEHECYDDLNNLVEVLDIITKSNKNIIVYFA